MNRQINVGLQSTLRKIPPQGGRAWDAFTELFRPVILQEVTLNSAMKPAAVYQDWDAVVELYSLLNLTFTSDKLVAISGLARSITTSDPNDHGDGYLAGLWQSTLPTHLLWTTEKIIEQSWENDIEVRIPERYEQYIAPSWSWASINGKISLAWCVPNYDSRYYLAKRESAEVTWDSNARFGAVRSGSLRMSRPACTSALGIRFEPPFNQSMFWEDNLHIPHSP